MSSHGEKLQIFGAAPKEQGTSQCAKWQQLAERLRAAGKRELSARTRLPSASGDVEWIDRVVSLISTKADERYIGALQMEVSISIMALPSRNTVSSVLDVRKINARLPGPRS